MSKQQSLELLLILLALFGCLARAETPPAPSPGTGLAGSIALHTISGGPVKKGVPDSRPLDHATFVVKQADQTITSFTTDAQGRFQISLPPGHYSISKKGWKGPVGFYGPFLVDITAGQIKQVQWNCDTGME